MVDPSLEGKTLVVTGANGRLGRVVSRTFLNRGARVAAVVRTNRKAQILAEEIDGLSDVYAADMRREEEVEDCFGAMDEQLKTIDGIVHTVGMWAETPLVETSPEEWKEVMSVNLTSTWLCFRKAAPLMNEGGCLIAFSSAQGADRGQPRQAAYSAAKAGVVRLVETTARELSNRDITAHAIAPSFIRYDESSNQPGIDASEIAELCVYLCTSGGKALNGATVRTYGSKL